MIIKLSYYQKVIVIDDPDQIHVLTSVDQSFLYWNNYDATVRRI